MDLIEQELGRKLTTKQVAEIVGLDPRTVTKYYADFGGVRVGGRRYLFFERRLIDALQKQEPSHKDEVSMGGAGSDKGKAEVKTVHIKKRSNKLGERPKGANLPAGDPYNIFG